MNIPIKTALWFSLRTDKIKKNGKAPISLFYTIEGARVRYNIGIDIYPAYWDKDNFRAAFVKPSDSPEVKLLPAMDRLSSSEIDEINQVLQSIKNDISKIESRFKALNTPLSSRKVIDEYKKLLQEEKKDIVRQEEPKGLLYTYMDQYIQDHQATREPGSLTVYRSVKNHLKAYEEATRHRVTFDTIDYQFFNRFQTFLINRTKTDKAGNVSPMLNNTTIAKALSTLKTFLSYARREEIAIPDSYRDFVIKKEPLEVIALEQPEFDAILNLDLTNNKRLEKCRDLFIFSCTTGLRYSDVAQLRREHIDNGVINLRIKKTKTELSIPLNAISASILDKYRDQARPLPVISNQKLNKFIKDLCQLAEITKPIEIVRFSGRKRIVTVLPKYELCHFHTGRKTFVTLSLEKGMSAEEVMNITGHTDYKSFKRYVKVTESRKKTVMVKAWGEISNLKIVG